ncbi:MAG: DUF11 domain-containing protein [Acidobacteriota bacterium]
MVPGAAASGSYPNTTSAITYSLNGSPVTGNTASDVLLVQPAPVVTKTFLDDPVSAGGSVELEFTVTNTSLTSAATDITFQDIFGTEIRTASVTPPAECCGTGSQCTFTPFFNPAPPCNPCDGIPGRLSLTGGTLAAGGSCTFSITLDVAADAAPGVYPNATTEITATVDAETVTGLPAADDLVVVAAPDLSKSFLDDPVAAGTTTTLEFTLSHSPNSPTAATDIAFTDDLEATLSGLTATLPVSPDPPCGAGSSLTASAGDSLLTFSGGTLQPGEECSFSVTVNVPAGAASGTYSNTTSGVGATVSGTPLTSPPAQGNLRVAGLALSKEFIGDPALPGDTVTLRFTIDKADAADDVSAIFFTDTLSTVLSGLMATAPLPSDPCGAGSSISGTTFLIFVGGALPPGEASCTFDVSVQVPNSAPDGIFGSVTSTMSATIGGTTLAFDPASDSLEVNSQLLSLAKGFIDDPVAPGETTTLRFTLTNLDAAEGITGIAFTDDLDATLTGLLPTGLPFAACGGMVEASPTPATISFSGGSLTAGEECVFDVVATVPMAAVASEYLNTTSSVSGLIGAADVSGTPASDVLQVVDRLDFTKSFDGPSTAGGTATLTFTITNPGSDAVNGLAFSDDLSATLAGLVATNLPIADVCGPGSLLTGTSFLAMTGGNLPPLGGTCSFDVDLQLPAVAPGGDYLNSTSDLQENGLVVAEPATATLTVLEADLGVTKTDGVTSATPGSSVVYTIVATNSGPNDAPSAAVADVFPAILTSSWTSVAAGGATGNSNSSGDLSDTLSMPSGSSVTYTVTCAIPADASGTLTNTVAIQDLTIADANPSNDIAVDNDTVLVPQSDLAVTKTDGVTSAVPGQTTLVYTIVASNLGPSNEAAATLTDTFPADRTCTYTSVAAGGATGNTANGAGDLAETLFLPVGSSVTYTATCDIDASASGTLSNTATIASSSLDPVPGNDSATDNDTVLSPEADLGVTKTDGLSTAVPGQTVTYTIVASNAGPSDDPAATLTDIFPSTLIGCTYTSVAAGGATGNTANGAGDLAETLSLPAGSSVTYTLTCTIDSAAGGVLSNTADIASSVTDPVSANDSASDDDVLIPRADLAITKTDGVTSAVPGESVTYTIIVSNNGPSDDPAATVADAFPSELTCTYTSVAAGGASGNTAGAGDLAETLSLPAASSVTYTAVCDIDSSATGTLSNTATVTNSVDDTIPANNSATDSDTVLTPESDVAVTKTDGVTSAVPGESLTYTIVASNNGPSDDTAAVLTDALPAELVSCTFTSVATGGASGNTAAGSGDLNETLGLPVGGEVTYTVECTIDPAATGTLSNTAEIAASTTDNEPTNDSATDDDTVLTPTADLEVNKFGPASITVGNTLEYAINVDNLGPSTATAVLLEDPTPAGLVFSSANSPCSGGFPCDLGTLGPLTGLTILANFEVPGDYAGPSPIENTATVSSDATDNEPANNSSTVSTDVVFDSDPPVVTDVSTLAGPLAECDALRQPIESLQITIEDDISDIVGADDPAAFQLLASGPDGDFATDSCGAPAGDDVAVEILSQSVDGVNPVTVSLRVADAVGLGAGLYRFLACDSIADGANNALDGDGDGIDGGDFVIPFFRADPENLLDNGHFDDCPVSLEPWIVGVTPPNQVQPGAAGTDDADGSPLSASVQLVYSTIEISSLAQCVPVSAGQPHRLEARYRFEPVAAAIASFVPDCEFFDGPACVGTSLGSLGAETLLEDTGGSWLSFGTEFTTPAGAVSALCDFSAEGLGTDLAFDLYRDALFFGPNALIFTDGFESGDVSAWSSTVQEDP